MTPPAAAKRAKRDRGPASGSTSLVAPVCAKRWAYRRLSAQPSIASEISRFRAGGRQTCGRESVQPPGATPPSGAYSIPSGPWASPLRNWRTNWLSELNSSDAGPGFDDPALPQHGDEVGHAAGGHDVVRDHGVGAAVLGVHLLDQLAEQRRAHRVEPRVRLVEEHDVRVHHERAREAGALAHAARELVRHLVVSAGEADLAQAPRHDLRDLLLALVGVLTQREGRVVEHVHRAEQGAVLEQHAELLAHLEQLVVGHVRHRLAVNQHVSLVRVEQADHVLDADRLARARRARGSSRSGPPAGRGSGR